MKGLNKKNKNYLRKLICLKLQQCKKKHQGTMFTLRSSFIIIVYCLHLILISLEFKCLLSVNQITLSCQSKHPESAKPQQKHGSALQFPFKSIKSSLMQNLSRLKMLTKAKWSSSRGRFRFAAQFQT